MTLKVGVWFVEKLSADKWFRYYYYMRTDIQVVNICILLLVCDASSKSLVVCRIYANIYFSAELCETWALAAVVQRVRDGQKFCAVQGGVLFHEPNFP